jgi:predicted Zn-dependent protease
VTARILLNKFRSLAYARLAVVASLCTPLFVLAASAKPVGPTVVADPAGLACQQGERLLLQGQPRAAEEAYRAAVKTYPQSLLALTGLASCLLAENKAYAALDQVNRMLLLAAPVASESTGQLSSAAMPLASLLVCAKVYHRTGHLDKCLLCYDAYLKAAPKGDEREQYEALAGVIRSQVNAAKVKPNQYVVTVGGAADYFKDAVSEGLFRWPLKRFPLRVHIVSADILKSYRPEYEEAVRQSIDDWDKATVGQIGLKIVDSVDDADITVNFVDDLHAPALRAEAGKAQLHGSMEGVDSASVQLLTLSPFPDQLMTKDFMRMIAVHEIGHALGLTGHSPYEEDVMFPALSNQRGITSRDVATLYKLYEIGGAIAFDVDSADLTDKGKIQLLFAEASKAKANKDTERALECFEQVLKIDSSNKNGRMLLACELNNLGLSKVTEPLQALKCFRWASYFDSEQTVYEKNISSCLFNLQIGESAASRLNQAQLCLAAKDYRGAVVEYRAAQKISTTTAVALKLAEAEKLAKQQGF